MDNDKSPQKLDEKNRNKSAILEEELESSPEKLAKDKTPQKNAKRDIKLMTGASNTEK